MEQTIATATQCVHTGTIHAPGDLGVNSPIFPSSAFSYVQGKTNLYPRYFNTQNQVAVAQKLAALEKGEEAIILSSGMAAISTAMLAVLRPGDHAVLQPNLYGGTHYFIATVFDRIGILYTYADGNDVSQFEQAILPHTKLLYIETPSNPLLEIVDVKAIGQLGRRRGITTMIDNTFASPINQQPLTMDIDIVAHSATKYLGGHSDISAGAIVTSKEIMALCMPIAINMGGCLDPNTCYLLERSMKTLSLRVNRQNENALAVATFLSTHPAVINTYYPGLPSHPGHAIAKAQMKGFGGMLSFEVAGGSAGADAVINKLQIIAKALSLGGVESTICEPTKTSHSKLSAEQRAEKGIGDGLLRLSVGIEDAADLIADLGRALG